jgi:hypothetical protein
MRWCFLVLLLVVADASEVRAQPVRSKADERFEAGRKLMEAKKYAEACTAFEDSQQLDPAVTTLLNLAACREKTGELASAVSVFRAAERAARQEGDAKSNELAQIAAGHVRRLEPRLSTLTIMVPREQRVAGLTIERSGVRIDEVQWNLPLPIDGGRYEIVAKAPRHVTWSTKLAIEREGDAKTIYVPELAEGREGTGGDERPDGPDQPEPRRGGKPSIVWPIAFTAGALASGGVAFWLWRRGDDIYADAKVEADPDRQDELWQSANRHRYGAQALAVTGIGLAAVAVWLFVRGGGDSSADDDVSLVPSLGDGSATVQLFGSF